LSEEEVESGIFPVKKESDCSFSISGYFIKKEKFKPCPFLSDDKKCKIHYSKPIICQKYPWEYDIRLLQKYHNINSVIFIIDNIDRREWMCQGFHVGEMTKEHLEPFVDAIKEQNRRAMKFVKSNPEKSSEEALKELKQRKIV
jgi:Fe-S-cluster containining protein